MEPSKSEEFWLELILEELIAFVPAVGGLANEPYITIAASGALVNERVLTGTANQIIVTDDGAGTTATLSLPQNIHVAASPTFAGMTINGNIIITGTVDGVDIQNHSARHDPGGADALTTAVPGAIQPDDAVAEGVAASLARSDHTHSIVAAVAGVIQPDDAAAEGVAASFSRSDHAHGIVAIAPSNIGVANAEGASTSFVRADHVHNHPAGLGANLHHNEAHVVDSAGPHTGAGLTIGHVLRASGAAAFSFAQLQHADLGGVTSDLHHTEVHVVNSTGPHAEAGLTIGHVLRATGAAAFSFAALIAADLPAHDILSAQHGDSLTANVVRGDVIIGNATPTWSRLGHGAAGEVLGTDGTDVSWVANVTPSAHNLLADPSHGDTVTQAVTRGSIIVGNATPKWDELVIGAANRYLHSDNTDATWQQVDHTHLSGVTSDLHHSEVHVVNSTGPHTEAGLTIGHMLRVSGAAAFSFAAIQNADIPAALDVNPGTCTVATANVAATPHTHAVTTSASPGATASILASDASGHLQLTRMILTSATAPLLDINPAFTATGCVIEIDPSAAISTIDAEWKGICIDGALLDPSVVDVDIHGHHIDLSGVLTTNLPHIDGLFIETPTGYHREKNHALHAVGGGIWQDWDGSTITGVDFFTVHNVVIDVGTATAGEIHSYDVAIAGTGTVPVYALGTHSGVGVIHQHIGTFVASAKGWDENGGFADITTKLSTAGGASDVVIFSADNDYLYISGSGVATTFDEIQVILAVNADKSIKPTFEFSTGVPGWTAFYPTDDTLGFQQDGTIRFDAANLVTAGWAVQDVNAEGQTRFWIRVRRTRNNMTSPTESTIKVLSAVEYGWDKDGDLSIHDLSVAGTFTLADVFLPDGGTVGIAGNELLTFNAAGNATFSGVGSVVVPDGAWVGADAACSWAFDSSNGDVTTLDKVGIGTAAPDYRFEIHAVSGIEPQFAMSNADVAQPATDIDQADVWGTILPISATAGGMKVRGLSDTDATAMIFQGIIGSANPTDTIPAIDLVAYKSNGGTSVAALGTTETVFQLHNYTAALITVLGNGNVGIGTTGPQGRLHGYDTISGFMHWEYDGVDGTARTVIPDAAGDVVYSLGGVFVVRASDGGVNSGTVTTGPGASETIYSVAADECELQVAADGEVTVQRTGGALTYKVALWLLWI